MLIIIVIIKFISISSIILIAIANNIIEKLELTLEYYMEHLNKIDKHKKIVDEKELNLNLKLETAEKLMRSYEVKFYACEKEKVYYNI